jgi:glutamate racemase
VQQPCPLFVPIAEEGLENTEIAAGVARHYLAPVAADARLPMALILGCTHYPLLRTTIQKTLAAMGIDDVAIFDSGAATAAALTATLEDRGLRNFGGAGTLRIRVTDDPAALGTIAARFLGVEPGPIEHVDVGTATG